MSIFTYALVFERGPRADRRIPFTPPQMTLGRASNCDIAIADPLLSRTHCRFELRNGHLWVVDLESANETLVNDAPITEQSLLFGDVVTVGDSVIRIGRAEETPAPAVVDEPAAIAPAEVVIDLGFDKADDDALPKKNLLRPLIWLVAAILLLGAGISFIKNASSNSDDLTISRPVPQDNTLQVFYEKVEASAENIFRYELTLTADGMLTVKLDDLSGTGRHPEKKQLVAKELLTELARDLEGCGFFALDKSYSGYALDPNTLNESHLIIAIGKKVHACKVTNRSDEPEDFRAAREKLETFSKNELGIWAFQLSAEKLTDLAQQAMVVAQKRYDERDVKFGNLHESLRNYRDAMFYLETINPKPEFYAEILDGFETAKKELDERYKQQNFRADKAQNTKEWQTAQRELKILCELIPDRSDPRHTTAMEKLLDVEKRLRQK